MAVRVPKSYELTWATKLDKIWLDAEMGRLSRQRMNLRTMPTARFLLLKAESVGVIGWAGVDSEFREHYPEIFSLHLDPDFRQLGLGLFLELVRATYLQSRNVRVAFVRMARDTSFRLLAKRLESRFYTEVAAENLSPEYADQCGGCELFGNLCQQPIFLKFDVDGFVHHFAATRPVLDFTDLPRRFTLPSATLEDSTLYGVTAGSAPAGFKTLIVPQWL